MRKIILGLLVTTFIGGIALSSVVNSSTNNNSIITVAEAKSKNLEGYMLASVQPADVKNTVDVEPVKVSNKVKKVTQRESELRCMAKTMYHEANGEGEIGLAAVGHVIINRVNHPKYPKTICGVVYDRNNRLCQFTYICTGAKKISEARMKELEQLASRIINNEIPDPTGGAIYFDSKPFNNNYMKYLKKIGGHWFYKNKKDA